MRTSQLLLSTVKETPADAEVISHQLMLRAGMIRKLASGLYSWLPLGLRALRKVERIVRDEMDAAGAQEVLMPAVQPAELWQESGRWEQYGPELLRLRDRHDREFCFGPTHEEVITDLIRREIRSYKQLPANFYQIQTKFRDEIRPRFGVMRAREFLMKDAYSFHIDPASLQETYEVMYQTYTRIFTRLGLQFRAVRADTGSIGGTGSHEFHVLAASGEDAIAFSTASDYAANVELAEALAPAASRSAPTQTLTTVDTPGAHSIAEVSAFLNVAAERCLKTLLVQGTDGIVALVLRGDHPRYADAVATHGHGHRLTAFVQAGGVHGLAVFRAQLEDMSDLDAALDGQAALAVRAGIALDHIAQIGDPGFGQIPFPIDAGEVLAVLIGPAHEVRKLDDAAIGDHRDL